MAKDLLYGTKLRWTEKKMAIVSFEKGEKPNINIGIAPEFMGHKDMITPEDLFVSSVNSCMMSYFINVAERMRVKLESYESSAYGILSEKGIDFIFSRIDINVDVKVKDEKSAKRAHRAIDMAKKGCFVANSIKSEVNVEYNISILE